MSSTENRPVPGYLELGYALAPGLISAELASFLAEHASVLMAAGGLDADPQVPGSWSVYGDPAFDTLLKHVTAGASSLCGLALVPTYSFVRLYLRGQELTPHKDRVECEHSATLHLASASDQPWPLCLRPIPGEPVELVLAPGDAVLYRGDRLLHWRDPLEDDWYLQVFLHWVDDAGPHANRMYDGRPTLGRPAAQRQG